MVSQKGGGVAGCFACVPRQRPRIVRRMLPNLLLIGFMGTGKSSIGRLAAGRLRFRFYDTDRLVVERTGLPIPEIFERFGEAHFRNLETGALESSAHLRHCVFATGGGIVVREENRHRLRELGFVVQLTASEEVIFERVSRNTNRPLLKTADPRATISAMLEARRPLYEATAHLTIDTSSASRSELARTIVTAAREAFGW